MDIKEQSNKALIEKIKDSALMNNPDVGELVSAFEHALKSSNEIKEREKEFRNTAISRISMFMKLFRQKTSLKLDEDKKHLNDIISKIDDISTEPEFHDIDTIFSRMDEVNSFISNHIETKEMNESKLKEQLCEARVEGKIYRKMSYIDTLTRVANRRFGEKYIHRLMCRKSNFSYIVIDIDHFKNINDKYGHCAGDELLAQASNEMKNIIGIKGLLCRTGGEEFAVILREGFEPYDIAEKIRKQIETNNFYIDGNECRITVSCGISSVCKHGEHFRKIADDKLYEAKRNGRNNVVQ